MEEVMYVLFCAHFLALWNDKRNAMVIDAVPTYYATMPGQCLSSYVMCIPKNFQNLSRWCVIFYYRCPFLWKACPLLFCWPGSQSAGLRYGSQAYRKRNGHDDCRPWGSFTPDTDHGAWVRPHYMCVVAITKAVKVHIGLCHLDLYIALNTCACLQPELFAEQHSSTVLHRLSVWLDQPPPARSSQRQTCVKHSQRRTRSSAWMRWVDGLYTHIHIG